MKPKNPTIPNSLPPVACWGFDKFLVKNGKITEAIPSKTLKPVLKSGKILVRVRGNWLERWYEFGRIDWVSELEYPEWTVKEVGRFLAFSS